MFYLRVNLNIAIVAMVNRTALIEQIADTNLSLSNDTTTIASVETTTISPDMIENGTSTTVNEVSCEAGAGE